MTLRKAFLTAAVLVLSVPVVPTLAHDDEDNGQTSHDRYHARWSDQHERAHDEGFESRAERRAHYRDLREQHDDAHGYQAPRYNLRHLQLRPQHRLYFFPDPQGQGSLRPTFPNFGASVLN